MISAVQMSTTWVINNQIQVLCHLNIAQYLVGSPIYAGTDLHHLEANLSVNDCSDICMVVLQGPKCVQDEKTILGIDQNIYHQSCDHD